MDEATLNAILENLNDAVLDLVEQLNESVVTERALIETLKELLPGFEKTFEQANIAEKTKIGPRAHELLASVEANLKKRSGS